MFSHMFKSRKVIRYFAHIISVYVLPIAGASIMLVTKLQESLNRVRARRFSRGCYSSNKLISLSNSKALIDCTALPAIPRIEPYMSSVF